MDQQEYTITVADVDMFLENLATRDRYYVEKMKVVAHRRLDNLELVPMGLVNTMITIVSDLECGIDGYDSTAYCPKAPGISLVITPVLYPTLWKHLPNEFVIAMTKVVQSLPKNDCSIM